MVLYEKWWVLRVDLVVINPNLSIGAGEITCVHKLYPHRKDTAYCFERGMMPRECLRRCAPVQAFKRKAPVKAPPPPSRMGLIDLFISHPNSSEPYIAL